MTLFACGGKTETVSSEEEQEKPFEVSVPVNMQEGTDFIAHELDSNNKWDYDEEMWYVNNIDKVPLPDPQVFEEEGVYYIVGTDDSSSCRYIPCYYTTNFVDYYKTNIYNPLSFSGGWENRNNPTMYAPEMYKVDDKYYFY